METQDEVQTSRAVDRREVLAIIRAIERSRSFVLWYEDVVRELRNIAGDELSDRLYEDIMERRISNVYGFPGPCSTAACDVVVVAPETLSEKQLNMIAELAKLYRFKGYDGDSEYVEVARTIHNFVKMATSGCYCMSDPAEAAYVLAASYGLVSKEEARLNRWGVGKVVYEVEGLNARIVKELFYCNGCIDSLMGNNYMDLCVAWRFG
jgi:hypothetical protein